MDRRRTNLLNLAPVSMSYLAASVLFYVFLAVVTRRLEPNAGFGSITADVLRAYGASYREGVWDGGWQRFVLPMFMHVNVIHILLNMWFLYRMGPPAEVHYGSSNFGTIYLLSGVGGICMGLLLGGYRGPAAGASTSLFGIMGAFLAVKVQACWDWRRVWRSREVREVAFMIGLNLLLVGLMFPNVDNWGHLGGLLSGFAYGNLFEYWRKRRRVGLVLVLAAVVLTAGAVVLCRWTVYDPHYYTHLALRDERAGRMADAARHFDEARERSKLFRSGGAAMELFMAALDAQEKGNVAKRDRYLEIMRELAPPGLYDQVVQWRPSAVAPQTPPP